MTEDQLYIFNRPIYLGCDSNGRLFVLQGSSPHKIFCYSNSRLEFVIDATDFEIEKINSFCIGFDDVIVLLDDRKPLIYILNKDLSFNKTLSLPDGIYSRIALSNISEEYFIFNNTSHTLFRFDKKFEKRSVINLHLNDDTFISKLCFSDQHMFLLDSKNFKLFKFSFLYLKLISVFNLKKGRGGKGFFRYPVDLEFYNEKFFILDSKNYMIQVFDNEMNYVSQIGSKGYLGVKFDLPSSLALINDRVYVCDFNNDRIVKLDKTFSKIKIVLERKFKEGRLSRPSGIAFVTEYDQVIIADRGNAKIQIFNKSLTYLESIGDTEFIQPSAIGITKVGAEYYLAVIDRMEYTSSKLTIFIYDPENFKLHRYSESDQLISLRDPQDITALKNGNFLIADTLNRRVIEVDINCRIVQIINLLDFINNKYILPKGVASDRFGNIYTVDFEQCKVLVFNRNGLPINTIDFSYFKDEIQVIRNIFIIKDYILLCVRGENQILLSDLSGQILDKVQSDGPLDWNNPAKIISSNYEDIFILDKENDRCVKQTLKL